MPMHLIRGAAVLAVAVALCSAVGAATDLSDPAEPWKTARAGITEQVPPPFEPLTVAADRANPQVSCWGRSYTLGAPLPVQIESLGISLLAGPIRVVLRQGGESTVLEGRPVQLEAQRQDRVEFSGQMQVGEITVSTPCSIEYDGLVDVDLTLSAAQPAQVQQLSVQIPVSPEVALFCHYSTQWGSYGYERVDELGESGLSRPWTASWWIGDHYRGLTFVTDTSGGWTGDSEQAFRLTREPDCVLLCANIIGEPTVIEGERRYRIGLQATPGKPLPVGWHGRQVGHASSEPTQEYARELLEERGTNIALLWHDSARFFSYPEPQDAEVFRQVVKTYHDAGLRCVYYITLSGVGLNSEVFRRNREQWLMTRPDGEPLFGHQSDNPDVAAADTSSYSSVCPASDFADWLVWAVDRAMAEYDLDGVYIDNPGPYYCQNQVHGCATRGARTHPYFAVRDLHKRLYTVVQAHKPGTGLVWEHNSRTSNSLNLTFVDIYSDGEHFRVKSKGTPEQMTRTLLDISGTGRQWGAQPAMLCSALNTREQYTWWMLARLLPFGNVMFSHPGWMDFSVYQPVLRARLDFGLDRVPVSWFTPEAVPEWFAYQPEELAVGGYVAQDGRALVTVSNLTDDFQVLRVPVAGIERELGGPVEIRDALTGAVCRPLGRNLVLSVPADSFRMLLIQRR